jgi:cyanophycin synthetase
LRDLDEDIRLGPSTGAIVSAAVARGIPYRRLTQGSLVQFGWGSKQKRIQAAETSFTSAIAEAIAQDKELTKKLLHASGVAVPYGRRSRTRTTPGSPRRKSACRWSSSRRTATRARAFRSI